ncbi:MAG: septum formation protein Maf [Sphaerobacteraceae bacterium]|nr:MAG: septum formation protein Maf [Sphaerobacteraceae bacterium]
MSTPTPLILASASPRRRELLAYLGVAFTVLPAEIDESVPESMDDPVAFARHLAETKASAIARRHRRAAVLAADTIVVADGRILDKPADAEAARNTLRTLRNRPHEVTTAVALAYESNVWVDHATTCIFMRDYTDEEIASYIASGDPFDKAGSYAIQDRRFHPVDRCEGCYCNVVGLPIVLTQRLMEEASLTVLDLNPPDLPPECYPCPLSEPANISNPLITW